MLASRSIHASKAAPARTSSENQFDDCAASLRPGALSSSSSRVTGEESRSEARTPPRRPWKNQILRAAMDRYWGRKEGCRGEREAGS